MLQGTNSQKSQEKHNAKLGMQKSQKAAVDRPSHPPGKKRGILSRGKDEQNAFRRGSSIRSLTRNTKAS